MTHPVVWADVRALVEAAGLGVPVGWPNEEFENPDEDPWLWVEVVGGGGGPMEIGRHPWRLVTGSVQAFVHVLTGTGVMQAAEIAERVTNVFHGLGPRAVIYGASNIGPGEAGDKDGNWFRLPVTIEFAYQVSPPEPEPQP